MGIFDDGSQQTIVDTARQQIDKIPAVFVEVFSAAYLATKIHLLRCPGRLSIPTVLSAISCATYMPDPQNTLEREAMLK